MHRRMVRLVVGAALLALAVGLVLSRASNAAVNSDWSSQTVQLAWFYKPPLNDPSGDALAEHFDTFILTKADEKTRQQLRGRGVTTPFLQYVQAAEVQDPGSCTAQPYRNQVTFKPGDYCMIRDEHPDWFLRDTNGELIVHLSGDQRYVQIDPGNVGWQQFFLERVREMQQEVDPTYGGTWDGVFLDNIDASLGRFRAIGVQPAAYPDDASYQAAVERFLQAVYGGYFQPEGRPLHANITELRDPAVWDRYLNNLDGAMDEGWAIDWGSGYLTAARWEADLALAETTQARGKRVLLVGQGSPANVEQLWQPPEPRQQFAFASYLLVADGNAAFRYGDSPYRYIWLYDNYRLDLGRPLGPRYQDGSLWRRDFERGAVAVDPLTHDATITVKPSVTIRATDAQAAERGANTGTFTIERTGSLETALTVRYTLGGTATNGTDYQQLSGTATIPAGMAATTLTVTPRRDSRRERSETVVARLAGGDEYVLGQPDSATVTISD